MINSKDNTPINVKKGVIYKLLKYYRKFGLYDLFIKMLNRFTSDKGIYLNSMSDIYGIIVDSWEFYDENLDVGGYLSFYYFPLAKNLIFASPLDFNPIRECSNSLWNDGYLWNWFKQYYVKAYVKK